MWNTVEKKITFSNASPEALCVHAHNFRSQFLISKIKPFFKNVSSSSTHILFRSGYIQSLIAICTHWEFSDLFLKLWGRFIFFFLSWKFSGMVYFVIWYVVSILNIFYIYLFTVIQYLHCYADQPKPFEVITPHMSTKCTLRRWNSEGNIFNITIMFLYYELGRFLVVTCNLSCSTK